MFSRWFITDSIPLDLCISYNHNKWLVILSYAVAAFASYTALHLIARVRSAPNSRIRAIWLATAGASMGCGIFAMHFIAMLAVRIPVTVQYDVAVTALSALFAIAASGIAFHFVSGADRSLLRLAIGAVILGSGIGLMHYTGMAALRMPARVYYDPALFGLSVAVAVVLSMMALYVLRTSRGSRSFWSPRARLAGSLVMGLAVTVMHYTGMLATYFYPEPGHVESGVMFDGTLMAVAVGTATLLISGLATVAAVLDSRAEIAEARRAQSESFLQTVIDNSADGILTFDEDLTIRTCNPAGARIFCRGVSEIVGRRLSEFIEDDVALAMRQADSARLREARAPRGDGEERVIEYTVNGMQFAGRRVFNCLVRDVTARRRAEDALRASEERFRNLVANVPGVVYQRRRSPDGEFAFTYISEQLRELVGLEPDEVVTDPSRLLAIVAPEDRTAILQSIERSAVDLTPWDCVFRTCTKGRAEKWIRTISRPRRLPNGAVIWDGLFLDVTDGVKQTEEKKALEAKLRNAQKMASLNTLAGGIAHEFNNMLVPIQGLTEIALRDVPEGSRAHKNLQIVVANAQRAAQIIDKVLSFSRREDNDHKAIDLAAVLADSLDLLRATFPATITFHIDIDASVGRIFGNETQFHQILMNLASNARHAMGGKVGRLTIALQGVAFDWPFEGRNGSLKPGAYAKLSVSDTGHGMNRATRERIFEPFFTTKEVGRGTGLGLAVIHGIVEAHGGAIEVASAPGAGTTFDIYLPLMREDEPALAINA